VAKAALDENEAYWAGLAVSMVMLGSGFSLLLFPMFTGYGAVILSMGIMTMIVVLMTKAVIVQIQKWMDYNARIEETVASILALRKQVIPAEHVTEAESEDDRTVTGTRNQPENKVQEEEIAAT
jgi:hypothetical protein